MADTGAPALELTLTSAANPLPAVFWARYTHSWGQGPGPLQAPRGATRFRTWVLSHQPQPSVSWLKSTTEIRWLKRTLELKESLEDLVFCSKYSLGTATLVSSGSLLERWNLRLSTGLLGQDVQFKEDPKCSVGT